MRDSYYYDNAEPIIILYLNGNGQVYLQVPANCQALWWSHVIYSLSLLQSVMVGKTLLRAVESFVQGY